MRADDRHRRVFVEFLSAGSSSERTLFEDPVEDLIASVSVVLKIISSKTLSKILQRVSRSRLPKSGPVVIEVPYILLPLHLIYGGWFGIFRGTFREVG